MDDIKQKKIRRKEVKLFVEMKSEDFLFGIGYVELFIDSQLAHFKNIAKSLFQNKIFVTKMKFNNENKFLSSLLI